MNNKFTRTFQMRAIEDGASTGTIRIAISSEEPYPRWYLNGYEKAYEVLGHKEGEVDLSYFLEGAPFAVEHDTRDIAGVLQNVSLDADGVLRADVKFSKSTRAKEIEQDIRDGIRTRISVGYEVLEFTDEGVAEDKTPIVRATLWRPYEASIVAVPADITVGVGKSHNHTNGVNQAMKLSKATVDSLRTLLRQLDDEEVESVTEEVVEAADALIAAVEALEVEVIEDTVVEEEVEEEEMEDEVVEEEASVEEDEEQKNHNPQARKSRNKESRMKASGNGSTGAKEASQLARIANEYNRSADLPTWLEEGRTVASVMDEILDSRSNAHKAVNPGMSTREKKEFSLSRSLEGFLAGEPTFVDEVGRSVAKKNGISTKSNALYIPLNEPIFKRTFTTAGNASALVANQYLTFEEALREQSIAGMVGVQMIEGQNNVLKMPRGDGATGAWVGEGSAITDSSSSFSTVTWEPKTYALTIPYTRQLGVLNGTYDVEDITRQDILGLFVEAAEAAIFAGAGGNAPTGIQLDTAVPSVATGSVSLAAFTAMWQEQRENKGSANNLAYVLTPGVYAAAQNTAQFSNTGPAILVDGKINGFPVYASNFLPTNLGSGAAHGSLFGNFSTVLAAHFGVVEIIKDEYTAAANGIVKLRAFMYMDSKARNPNHLVRKLGFNLS